MKPIGRSEQQARLLRAGGYLAPVGQYGLFGCSAWDLTAIGRRYGLRGRPIACLTGADGRERVADIGAGEGCAGGCHAGAWLDFGFARDGVRARRSEYAQPVPCRMNDACEER